MLMAPLERLLPLKFQDASLEARFAQDYSERFVVQLRFALLLGMLFMLGDAGIDFAFDRSGAFGANMIRLFIVLPFAALSFAITFWPPARSHLETYCAVGIIAAAAGLFWAMARLERDGGLGLSSWVGALNFTFVLLFLFLVLGIRFARAAVVGAIITVMFLAATFLVLDPGSTTIWQYSYHIVTVFLLCAFLGYWREQFIRRVFQVDAELAEERARTDGILHELIPPRIVSALKSTDPPIAEPIGEATVLFADIEGFTHLATRLGPEHLLETLDRVFHAFDKISDANGVEKVKIIGDCYMAVATSGSSSEAAGRAVRCGLAWQTATAELGEDLGIPMRLRIGAHTGSLIGGVIGARRWAYDYWGSTVNVASRIQHAAEAGEILISETTFWRCRDEVTTEPAGNIALRGYGSMACYRVLA